MKKIVLFISFFFLVSSLSFAQRDGKRNPPKDKIEALEKIKLIETLNMSEETTIKFFARRNEHQEKMKDLFNELDDRRDQIKDKISSARNDNDPEFRKLVEGYFDVKHKLDEERERFIISLTDILSNKQIAELTLFERRFREEIRDVLINHKKKKRN